MLKSCIILCGGKGLRFNSEQSIKIPKTLALIQGKPIIWYIIKFLISQDFNHFILPLGYMSEKVQGYIEKEFSNYDIRLDLIKTGEDSSISYRVYRTIDYVEGNYFLLINGDTIIDFNINKEKKSLVDDLAENIFYTTSVQSKYGIFIFEKNKLSSFSRSCIFNSLQIDDGLEQKKGYIFSGVSILSKNTLNKIDLLNTIDFEEDVFNQAIKDKTIIKNLKGFWYPIDTQKDLKNLNENKYYKKKITEIINKIK